MGKADELEGARKGSVGFALTALQRRLASSPETIYQFRWRRVYSHGGVSASLWFWAKTSGLKLRSQDGPGRSIERSEMASERGWLDPTLGLARDRLGDDASSRAVIEQRRQILAGADSKS
jgi:hypothetical protein